MYLIYMSHLPVGWPLIRWVNVWWIIYHSIINSLVFQDFNSNFGVFFQQYYRPLRKVIVFLPQSKVAWHTLSVTLAVSCKKVNHYTTTTDHIFRFSRPQPCEVALFWDSKWLNGLLLLWKEQPNNSMFSTILNYLFWGWEVIFVMSYFFTIGWR